VNVYRLATAPSLPTDSVPTDAPVRAVRPRPARVRRFSSGNLKGREVTLDDFRRYFPYTPTALAIKECARLAVVRRYPCPEPVLDVGCGDGLFALMAFGSGEVWGIDVNGAEGRWAAASQAYRQVILGDVTRAKLPSAFFSTCVANCSLEHVPRIDLALRSIYESLKPGGTTYLFVPNAEWAHHFNTVRLLERMGAPSLALGLQHSIDAFFKHHHLYDERGWREVVGESGLEVVACEPVLSTATTVAFEAFLLPSLAGWLNKHLTTRWTNFPAVRQVFAAPVFRLVQAVMNRADTAPTAEFLVVARRPGS
jgi:SAM-dependent methyltransferase